MSPSGSRAKAVMVRRNRGCAAIRVRTSPAPIGPPRVWLRWRISMSAPTPASPVTSRWRRACAPPGILNCALNWMDRRVPNPAIGVSPPIDPVRRPGWSARRSPFGSWNGTPVRRQGQRTTGCPSGATPSDGCSPTQHRRPDCPCWPPSRMSWLGLLRARPGLPPIPMPCVPDWPGRPVISGMVSPARSSSLVEPIDWCWRWTACSPRPIARSRRNWSPN